MGMGSVRNGRLMWIWRRTAAEGERTLQHGKSPPTFVSRSVVGGCRSLGSEAAESCLIDLHFRLSTESLELLVEGLLPTQRAKTLVHLVPHLFKGTRLGGEDLHELDNRCLASTLNDRAVARSLEVERFRENSLG